MIAHIKSRIPVAGRGSIYHLKITLAEVKPPIWRRLRVPGEANLGWLHAVIQVAMGWTNSHLHQFTSGGTVYSDREPTPPRSHAPGRIQGIARR